MSVAPMPKSVKVGALTYSIIRKPASGMSNCLGHCGFDDLQIWVRQRLKKAKAQETLVHEVLHACTHPSVNGDKRHTDEQFVEAVAPVLLQVLQDNPELVEYLTK